MTGRVRWISMTLLGASIALLWIPTLSNANHGHTTTITTSFSTVIVHTRTDKDDLRSNLALPIPGENFCEAIHAYCGQQANAPVCIKEVLERSLPDTSLMQEVHSVMQVTAEVRTAPCMQNFPTCDFWRPGIFLYNNVATRILYELLVVQFFDTELRLLV